MPADHPADHPVAPAAPSPAASGSTADASDGRGVLLITNARAGTSVVRTDPLPEIRRRLPQARIESLGDSSMDDIVASAVSAADAPTVLAVLGGDGSVSRAAHLARRHDLTLLVLPGGVSLGSYPELLAEREKRTSLGKWWGGAVAAWREIHGAHRITIVRDGRRAVVWSVFAGLGRNDPRRIAMMRRASLDEAVLDVRLHHARGTRLRAVTSLAFGRRTLAVMRALRLMPPASDLERAVVAEIEVTVRPGGATPVFAHDGELTETPAGDYRLRLRAIPDGLRVYAR
ncbi:MAG: hypothetical protein K0S49_1716 [Microbacterium sp.]|nr:hypothetical protein [Microbacterium sp.]